MQPLLLYHLQLQLCHMRHCCACTPSPAPLQRTKKRRWKAAYVAATSEVQSLHKQLLAKQKELEGLEGRLKRLETELRLLGAGAGTGGGVRLPAAALLSKGELMCLCPQRRHCCLAAASSAAAPRSVSRDLRLAVPAKRHTVCCGVTSPNHTTGVWIQCHAKRGAV